MRLWTPITLCLSFKYYTASALGKSSSEFPCALHAFVRLDEKGEYFPTLQQHESARLVNFLDAV